MQDDKNAILNVARYKPGPGNPIMYAFTLVERDKDNRAVAKVTADRAQWQPESKSWRLTNGQRLNGLLYTEGRQVTDVPAYKSNVTPEEINLYRQGNYVEWLPTRRIDELLARPQSYGTEALLRVKHTRFTQPLINIILLLLAIPTVLSREPTRLKSAATKCLALTGLCLIVSFLGQQLAGQPPTGPLAPHWPALMAWLPILLFGPVAVFLLDRVET
jgi:lipopolysaccharide export LptBFGC system permease protein LptF